jgi:hypothetical protein
MWFIIMSKIYLGLATFWDIFSKTYQVTLSTSDDNVKWLARRIQLMINLNFGLFVMKKFRPLKSIHNVSTEDEAFLFLTVWCWPGVNAMNCRIFSPTHWRKNWVVGSDFGYLICDADTWDRCYDFLNIFAEKFSGKIGIFCSSYC